MPPHLLRAILQNYKIAGVKNLNMLNNFKRSVLEHGKKGK